MRTAVLTALLVLFVAPAAFAQLPEGSDLARNLRDADNTRVTGVVYDPDGQPLNKVNVWLFNDRAPANPLRARTRKSGLFLVRNLTNIYREEDVHGIYLRARFELEGYQPVEAKLAVERDQLGQVHPIMWPEGTQPQVDGICVLVTGTVSSGPKKKGVRGATVRITAADAPDLLVETVADKSGYYEALLWDVPEVVNVHIEGNGMVNEVNLRLAGDHRPDLVAVVGHDVELGG